MDRARRAQRLVATSQGAHMKLIRPLLLILALVLALPHVAAAQGDRPPAPREDDPDRDINVSQPDFNLAALPTTLRLLRYGSAFRVTHRFTRPLGEGDLGDLA